MVTAEIVVADIGDIGHYHVLTNWCFRTKHKNREKTEKRKRGGDQTYWNDSR